MFCVYATDIPGNDVSDKVVIIVDKSESDKVEDQMVSECPASNSDDIMGGASKDMDKGEEIIEYGGDVIVGGAVVGGIDAFTSGGENDKTISRARVSECGYIMDSATEGETVVVVRLLK